MNVSAGVEEDLQYTEGILNDIKRKLAFKNGNISEPQTKINVEQALRLEKKIEAHQEGIKELALSAKIKSEIVRKFANEVVFGQNVSSDVVLLRSELAFLKDNFDDVITVAEEELKETEKVYDESARLLSKVESVNLPDLFISQSENDEEESIKETAKNVDQHLNEFVNLRDESLDELKSAKKAIEVFKVQDVKVKKLIRTLNKIKEDAERSEKKAADTWGQAESTFKILNGKKILFNYCMFFVFIDDTLLVTEEDYNEEVENLRSLGNALHDFETKANTIEIEVEMLNKAIDIVKQNLDKFNATAETFYKVSNAKVNVENY